MTVKEYLRRPLQLSNAIERKENMVARLRSSSEGTSPGYGTVRIGNADEDRIGNVVSRVLDLEAEIAADRDLLLVVKQEVRSVLMPIKDVEGREVLMMRYCNLMMWEEIAEILGYDLRRLMRIHARAVKEVRIAGDE